MRLASLAGLSLVALMGLTDSLGAAIITNADDPALAGATVIDFETVPTGMYSTLSVSNVTFSTDNVGAFQITSSWNGFYGTQGNALANFSPTANPIRIDFASSVTAFGFSWGAADGSWTMQLFGTDNQLLESHFIPEQTSPYVGFIGAGNLNISHAVLTGSYDDLILIDNFKYVTASQDAAVPEPATLAIWGFGAIGCAVAAYRRRKQSA
jgi:hypothetical protein